MLFLGVHPIINVIAMEVIQDLHARELRVPQNHVNTQVFVHLQVHLLTTSAHAQMGTKVPDAREVHAQIVFVVMEHVQCTINHLSIDVLVHKDSEVQDARQTHVLTTLVSITGNAV